MEAAYLLSSIVLPLLMTLPLPFKAALVGFTGVNYYMFVKEVEVREVRVREADEAAGLRAEDVE